MVLTNGSTGNGKLDERNFRVFVVKKVECFSSYFDLQFDGECYSPTQMKFAQRTEFFGNRIFFLDRLITLSVALDARLLNKLLI